MVSVYDCGDVVMTDVLVCFGYPSEDEISAVHRFDSDIELQMALSCQGKDKAEYEKWIRLWLMRNPEFRTTTGKTKVYL